MRRKTCLILALLPASVLASASSCDGQQRPRVDLTLPADTFARADRPAMTAEALDSEEALEAVQDARDRWGLNNARALDAACRLVRDTAVKTLICRPARAEWE